MPYLLWNPSPRESLVWFYKTFVAFINFMQVEFEMSLNYCSNDQKEMQSTYLILLISISIKIKSSLIMLTLVFWKITPVW